jgi:hypothetical protein
MYRFAFDLYQKYVLKEQVEKRASQDSEGSKRPLLDLLLDAEEIIESTTEQGSSTTENTDRLSDLNPMMEDVQTDRNSGSRKKKNRTNSKNRPSGGSQEGL